MTDSWARIEAKADRTATVDIFSEIGSYGISAAEFTKQVRALDVDSIEVHINSPGGSVFDGLAILNTLRQHKARVVVTVDALAASAASVIAMAGDEVVMARNSQMMVHDASGVAVGNSSTMSELAALLDKASDNLASIYADRAGGSPEEWRAAMRAETWYSDEEAVTAGLADRVLPKPERAADTKAGFDLSIFAHAGRADAPAPFIPQTPSAEPVASTTPNPTQEVTVAEPTTLRDGVLQRLGVTDTAADDATVLAALDEVLAEQAAPVVITNHAAPAGGPDQLAEITRLSAQVAEMQSREASREKAEFLNAASAQGRITPAERGSFEAMYDQAPDATRAFILARAVGSAVPVASAGHAGDTPAPSDDYPMDLLPANHSARQRAN